MRSEPPPQSLEHPLPSGMRDLLPEEAAARRALAKKVLDRFEVFGFSLVTPPVFEFADVLEDGRRHEGKAKDFEAIEHFLGKRSACGGLFGQEVTHSRGKRVLQ